MICHEPENILHSIAVYCLTRLPDTTKSWFNDLAVVTNKYGLPHSLSLLHNPPTKGIFKKLVKQKVSDYWQYELREEAKPLVQYWAQQLARDQA